MTGTEDRDDVFPPDAGYLYALVNPVWPGLVKMGFAGSVKRRFFSYQTGDPYRAYRMIGWSDVLLSPREAEKVVHEALEQSRVTGSKEWFRVTEAQAIVILNAFRKQPITGSVPQPEEIPGDWYSEVDESAR